MKPVVPLFQYLQIPVVGTWHMSGITIQPGTGQALVITNYGNTSKVYAGTFRGSAGRVTGTINTRTLNGVVDPTWECKVDNITYAGGSFSSSLNDYDLCKWFGNEVSDGEHTLTVTVRSNGQAFLFDRFQYVSSPGVTIPNAEVSVSYLDPAVDYGSGWQRLGDIAYMATDGGAVVNIPFYGTGITWMGITPNELPRTESRAQWQIDRSPSTSFTVPGTRSLTNHFVEVFRTSSVTRGHHTLTVTHLGTTPLTPLVLSRLPIHNGMLPEPARPPTDSGGGDNGRDNGGGDVNGGDNNTPIDNNAGRAGNSSVSSRIGPTASPTSSGSTRSSAQVTITVTRADGTVQITAIPDPLAVAETTDTNGGLGTLDDILNSLGSKRPNIGAIVGGVVGGVALILIILVVALWFWRKKVQEARRDADHPEHVMPFTDGNGLPSNTSRDNIASSTTISPFQTVTNTPNSNYTGIPNMSEHQSSGKGSIVNRHPAAAAFVNEKNTMAQTPGSPSTLSQSQTISLASTVQTPPRSKYREALGESLSPGNVNIHHQDSGIRLITDGVSVRPVDRLVVVEHPPIYSAS